MKDADLVAVAGAGATVDEAFGCTTVDVPAERWFAAATSVRDDPRTDCGFFDWLSAYDDRAAGFAVVVRVWSVRHRHGVLLRTHVPRADAELASLTGVWPGANWHERETFEMFDIRFAGHPNPLPLLLPDGFDGHPLRKEFGLASRTERAWPGAKDPGESDADLAREAEANAPATDAGRPGPSRSRRRARPLGVPDPDDGEPGR